jgi:hypothetical protein
MVTLFPMDPLQPARVDPDFESERSAALEAGAECQLIDLEALAAGNPVRAVRRVAEQAEPRLAIYRGWMLEPAKYGALFEALRSRGVELIDTPEGYVTAHHLPLAYAWLKGRTPPSVWLDSPSGYAPERVAQALAAFGTAPVIVKDYVKSQKHYWHEACFIPDASKIDHAMRVVQRFIELQDGMPEGGLVFRAFVQLAPAGAHPKSGMPLSREWRLFALDGKPLACAGYWTSDGEPPSEVVEDFCALARSMPTRFLSMDLALTAANEWIVIEVGSAQVSGLPDALAPERFYQSLAALWPPTRR